MRKVFRFRVVFKIGGKRKAYFVEESSPKKARERMKKKGRVISVRKA